MRIEETTVRKLRIAGVAGLDPIDVYLESVGPSSAKLTLTCFDKPWTAYWGATGGRDAATFVRAASVDYLVNCLHPGIESQVYDAQEVPRIAMRDALRDRRERLLRKDEAKSRWDNVRDHVHVMDNDYWAEVDVMQLLLGVDWLERLPMKPNPDYVYLARIVEAVRAALAGARPQQGGN